MGCKQCARFHVSGGALGAAKLCEKKNNWNRKGMASAQFKIARGTNFQCFATIGDGCVVVGSRDGKTLMRMAKTTFLGFGSPITHVDVTYDEFQNTFLLEAAEENKIKVFGKNFIGWANPLAADESVWEDDIHKLLGILGKEVKIDFLQDFIVTPLRSICTCSKVVAELSFISCLACCNIERSYPGDAKRFL
eukprot:Gb_00721 [translate_table: standard]